MFYGESQTRGKKRGGGLAGGVVHWTDDKITLREQKSRQREFWGVVRGLETRKGKHAMRVYNLQTVTRQGGQMEGQKGGIRKKNLVSIEK